MINWINETLEKVDKKLSRTSVIYKDFIPSSIDENGKFTTIYEKSPGCEVFFSTASSDSSAQIDSEGAQTSQVYQISGKDVVLVIEDATSRIAWIDEDYSTTFTLIATDMSSDDLLSIAEQLIENISK